MTVLNTIRASLSAAYDAKLVSELLEAYVEAKKNFYLGGHRLAEVEAGRFCEAAFRLLEQRVFKAFTSIGKQLDSEGAIRRLVAVTTEPDSVRMHIPRALRLVYDIRNKRDAAHLGDGIDPNRQDATLVAGVLDWVLAEFLRLHHSVGADEAQRIVDDLVERRAPVVEDFDGFLKVLRPELRAGDFVLLLLYQRGRKGAAFVELQKWVTPKMRANLKRTLDGLTDDKAHIHAADGRYEITGSGRRYVEAQRLYEPI